MQGILYCMAYNTRAFQSMTQTTGFATPVYRRAYMYQYSTKEDTLERSPVHFGPGKTWERKESFPIHPRVFLNLYLYYCTNSMFHRCASLVCATQYSCVLSICSYESLVCVRWLGGQIRMERNAPTLVEVPSPRRRSSSSMQSETKNDSALIPSSFLPKRGCSCTWVNKPLFWAGLWFLCEAR